MSTLQRHLPLSALGRQQSSTPQPAATPGLIEVEVKPVAEAEKQIRRSNLSVWLSTGRRIEVEKDFDPETLQRLVRALENQ